MLRCAIARSARSARKRVDRVDRVVRLGANDGDIDLRGEAGGVSKPPYKSCFVSLPLQCSGVLRGLRGLATRVPWTACTEGSRDDPSLLEPCA